MYAMFTVHSVYRVFMLDSVAVFVIQLMCPSCDTGRAIAHAHVCGVYNRTIYEIYGYLK